MEAGKAERKCDELRCGMQFKYQFYRLVCTDPLVPGTKVSNRFAALLLARFLVASPITKVLETLDSHFLSTFLPLPSDLSVQMLSFGCNKC
jgi:hypothetical protein